MSKYGTIVKVWYQTSRIYGGVSELEIGLYGRSSQPYAGPQHFGTGFETRTEKREIVVS